MTICKFFLIPWKGLDRYMRVSLALFRENWRTGMQTWSMTPRARYVTARRTRARVATRAVMYAWAGAAGGKREARLLELRDRSIAGHLWHSAAEQYNCGRSRVSAVARFKCDRFRLVADRPTLNAGKEFYRRAWKKKIMWHLKKRII